MKNVLTRSQVGPADDIININRKVTFKDDVQKNLKTIEQLNNTFEHKKAPKPTDAFNVDDDSDFTDDEAEDEDLGIASRTRQRSEKQSMPTLSRRLIRSNQTKQ